MGGGQEEDEPCILGGLCSETTPTEMEPELQGEGARISQWVNGGRKSSGISYRPFSHVSNLER